MRCDKTEQAIARLENETYGYFEITGEPIDLKRLIAQPATSLSLATQETRERRVAEDLTTSKHVKSSAQPHCKARLGLRAWYRRHQQPKLGR